MFSLIISIIAIALVVALAGASLYYGGDAFSQGSARAQASTFVNQGQQVAAAHTLYKNDEGGSALVVDADQGIASVSLAALVTGGYLASVPSAPSDEWNVTDYDMDNADGDSDTATGTERVVSIDTVEADADHISAEVCAEIASQAGNSTGIFQCVEGADADTSGVADTMKVLYRI